MGVVMILWGKLLAIMLCRALAIVPIWRLNHPFLMKEWLMKEWLMKEWRCPISQKHTLPH